MIGAIGWQCVRTNGTNAQHPVIQLYRVYSIHICIYIYYIYIIISTSHIHGILENVVQHMHSMHIMDINGTTSCCFAHVALVTWHRGLRSVPLDGLARLGGPLGGRAWHQLSIGFLVLHSKTHGFLASYPYSVTVKIHQKSQSHFVLKISQSSLGKAYGYPYPDNSGAKFMTESRLLAVLAVVGVHKAWNYD